MMNKALSLLLALCLLACGSAAAETAGVAETADAAQNTVDGNQTGENADMDATATGDAAASSGEGEYETTDIFVDALALGFKVPADFIPTNISPEAAAQGLVYSAASPDLSYNLQVTVSQIAEEALRAKMSADEGVENMDNITIGDIAYLVYAVPAEAAYRAVLFVGDDQALTFSFLMTEGADAGSVPNQILGSVFDL